MSSHVSRAPLFDRWLDRFFDFFYERHPVDATFAGIHCHDHALPDFSLAACAKAALAMTQLRNDLCFLPSESLSQSQQHDRILADGVLEIQLWENASQNFHFGNPSLYTGEAIFAVMSLFHRDREPIAERTSAAIARMQAIPAFLAQARENVTSAPLDWTERAIRESNAGIEYFGTGLHALALEYGIQNTAFLAAAEAAALGFRAHVHWLDKTLRNQAIDFAPVGRDAFELLLSRGHQLPADQDAAWVLDYAKKALATAHVELADRAAKLDANRTWQVQLAELPGLHPTVDAYYDSYRSIWTALKQASIEADLLTWPDYPIEYGPFPESDRAAAGSLYYLFYRCPAPFGKSETHFYRVTPISATMPLDEQNRRLSANNDSVIKLNHVVHHGGLGHHVQNWNAFRAKSRIGQVSGVDGSSRLAMFSAGTLVEGWACYATDLAEEIGFLTPLETLAEQLSRARMAARAVVDVALHTGEMSLDQAAAFYEAEAGMSAAQARGEAVKNSMFPGGAMMYLVGTQAIHDLRATIAARDGAAFSLRRFHDQFLSFGAIPVAMIADAMLTADAAAPRAMVE